MLETQMDEWMICFDELNVLGADVEKYIRNDAESIQQLNMKLQELKMRWDSVVQRMEQLSKEVRTFQKKFLNSNFVFCTKQRILKMKN